MDSDNGHTDLTEFIVSTLNNSGRQYIKRLKKCRDRFSENAVHDLRVSIRRLLAFVTLLEDIMPNQYGRRLKKDLKKQLDMFNPLRDTQVQLIAMKTMIYTHPVLYTFYNHLLNKEILLIDKLREMSARLPVVDIQGSMFFLKMYVKYNTKDLGKSFNDLFDNSHARYKDVMEKLKEVDIKNLDTIHKLRLAFKKFRYVMEVLQPVTFNTRIDLHRMKDIQTVLGNIQDNRVLMDDLNSFIISQTEINPESYQSAKEDILAKRTVLLAEFMEKSKLISSLWKKNRFRLKTMTGK